MPTFYAQTIFAKPLDQITEADLTSYFQQERDETLNLEFKSYTDKPGDTRGQEAKDAEKIKGVLKTISAFLNSSGGLLIWGAPESVEVKRGEKKVKMCKGPLAPVPKYYDRDDFINKIAGQISPVPAGVRMQLVQVAGGYVYLFDVPESQNKPHQNDGRYYVRMDTRTDAAPHYLVYALCHQIRTPVLNLEIEEGSEIVKDAHSNLPVFNQLKLKIINTTPYINDVDIYVLCQSSTIQFINKRNPGAYVQKVHEPAIAKLLPLGLEALVDLVVILPADFEHKSFLFDIWYGGGKSNVAQATYSLSTREENIGVDLTTHRRFVVNTTLTHLVGLDWPNEPE